VEHLQVPEFMGCFFALATNIRLARTFMHKANTLVYFGGVSEEEIRFVRLTPDRHDLFRPPNLPPVPWSWYKRKCFFLSDCNTILWIIKGFKENKTFSTTSYLMKGMLVSKESWKTCRLDWLGFDWRIKMILASLTSVRGGWDVFLAPWGRW